MRAGILEECYCVYVASMLTPVVYTVSVLREKYFCDVIFFE